MPADGGAVLAFFPATGELVVAARSAAGAANAERAAETVATCGPGSCAISRSPNDATGAAVAFGIAGTTADGLSAVMETAAINASASETTEVNRQVRCQPTISAREIARSVESACTQGFRRPDDKVKERWNSRRLSWLGKACLLDWANHACPRPRRNRCSSSSIACSRRCCRTRYSRHCSSRNDSSTSRFCRCCR